MQHHATARQHTLILGPHTSPAPARPAPDSLLLALLEDVRGCTAAAGVGSACPRSCAWRAASREAPWAGAAVSLAPSPTPVRSACQLLRQSGTRGAASGGVERCNALLLQAWLAGTGGRRRVRCTCCDAALCACRVWQLPPQACLRTAWEASWQAWLQGVARLGLRKLPPAGVPWHLPALCWLLMGSPAALRQPWRAQQT